MNDSRTDFAALWLAAIVESSEDAIISKDLNGIVTSWNRAAERMFGYTAEEAIGRSLAPIVPADRVAEEDDVLRRVRHNESLEHLETVRQRKDGSLIEVSISVSPIRDKQGVIIGASNITRDITERKRSEAALAELQQRLLSVVSASSAILQSPTIDDVQTATLATATDLLTADAYALWRIDAASGSWKAVATKGISEGFATRVIAARNAGGQLGSPLREAMAVPDVFAEPMLAPQYESYREEGVRAILAFPLMIGGLRSGSLVFYYRQPHAFTPIDIQAGQALANVASAAISAADLYDAAETGKQQATFLAKVGTLLASSLDYEKTLAAVAELAVPYVADWCGVDIVEAGGQLKRLAVAHVDRSKVQLARALEERYPDDPRSPAGVHQVIRTGQPTMVPAISRDMIAAAARDEDHLRLLEELALTSYMCVPLIARGRTLGAITLVTAESGRHYDAGDLQFAQDLAARAAMAIDNALAYQQATDANRLKDDFLATLSHELRTPLNAVLGYARMLNMNVLDASKQAHAVAVIERNASALKKIIEDVLDVSRIVSGKLRLHVQPVNLADVVTNALATISPVADVKQIRLNSVSDLQLPPVFGDPDRLQQIIWNLLSNAVKFTPKGGRVEIRLQRANAHAEIVVSDTGRGISREFLPHLFERFRQADSAFSREQGGLGLGLAIVRELVELHGGTVHASSDGPGSGATFTVQLPLATVEPQPPGPSRGQARAEREEPETVSRRLEGLKVLAVDDEDDALTLLREILESAGAEVATAPSAARALQLLHESVPDVLIVDIGMPEVDGLQFIRRVRQDLAESGRRVPAAALTAYARSQDRVTALASGFQMHIAKPVDPGDLVVTVAALANRND